MLSVADHWRLVVTVVFYHRLSTSFDQLCKAINLIISLYISITVYRGFGVTWDVCYA
jgi:hypothetical protein